MSGDANERSVVTGAERGGLEEGDVAPFFRHCRVPGVGAGSPSSQLPARAAVSATTNKQSFTDTLNSKT